MKRWSLWAMPALGAVLAAICAPLAAKAATEKLVYSFATKRAGSLPEGALIRVGGHLIGTTSAGGDGHCGTIFRISAAGGENLLHTCQGNDGGTNSTSALVEVGGTLFGTTPNGGDPGQAGYGTVFSITPQGAYTQLHAFAGPDGANPTGRLVAVDGVLYGMTAAGGTDGCGTVFSITPHGQLTTVHSFVGTDGCYPNGGLTAVGGKLYGVTSFGGIHFRGLAATGHGLVFAYVPGGAFSILHAFHDRVEGHLPNGDLLAAGNDLYGTTASGRNNAQGGNLFRLKLNGRYKVLHIFGPSEGSDGSTPNGGLILFHGVIFGTTRAGGGAGDPGTVFSITRNGIEAVIHAFRPAQGDGQAPEAGLVALGGVLYGTTATGGTGTQCGFSQGCGTVYAITP